MDIKVGDYIKTKQEITGKDGQKEIIAQYYKVLFVDVYIEVVSFGNGTPFAWDVVHDYDDSLDMRIIPDKDIKVKTVNKRIIHKGIEVQHEIAQRYKWNDRTVVIPFPQVYFNGTEFAPLDVSSFGIEIGNMEE